MQHTDTLSRTSRSLKKISETLHLRIQRTKDKAKEGWPKITHQTYKKRKTPRSQRRTQESGVSSVRAPLITQVSVRPSSHWWLSWRLQNQMHVLTLSQNPIRGITKGSKPLTWSQRHYCHCQGLKACARRSRGGGASFPLTDVGEGFTTTIHCSQWEPKEPHFSRGHEAFEPTDYTTPATV